MDVATTRPARLTLTEATNLFVGALNTPSLGLDISEFGDVWVARRIEDGSHFEVDHCRSVLTF